MGVKIPDTSLLHPFRRSQIDTEDLDSLLGAIQMVKQEIAALRELDQSLRVIAERKSEGTTKTRRLISSKYEGKIVLADDNWDQKTLKWLWANRPEFSQIYLRIGSILPNMREVKKLESSAGDEDFGDSRAVLLGARSPSTAPPTITITERF